LDRVDLVIEGAASGEASERPFVERVHGGGERGRCGGLILCICRALVYRVDNKCRCNIRFVSLSFQLPAFDGFGTGFLIFNLTRDLSKFSVLLTVPSLSRPDLGAAAGGAVAR
jgi:hypothetical protein